MHLRSRGIFDKAIAKVEREENEDQEVTDYLRKKQDEDDKFEKRRQSYEKNFADAEK